MIKYLSYRSKYRILEQIGQGQFGRVYFAISRKTGKFFALKSLAKGFPTNRFLREFSCLISLRHPNIVACKSSMNTHCFPLVGDRSQKNLVCSLSKNT